MDFYQIIILSILGVIIPSFLNSSKYLGKEYFYDIKVLINQNKSRFLVSFFLIAVLQVCIYFVPEALEYLKESFGLGVDTSKPLFHAGLASAIHTHAISIVRKDSDEVPKDNVEPTLTKEPVPRETI